MAKIDIISGFLGAGKTTLMKKLITEALKGEQLVVIENEFGEIGIDGGFLKDAGIQVTEMNSGCICCTLVGDFGTALKEVLTVYHPDRILIEPSGVGKLSDVIKALGQIAEGQEAPLNSCTTVVDAKKCRMYMHNFGEFFNNQVEYAKTIVLSRTKDIADEKLDQCIQMLRNLNQEAVIITTPWDQLDGRLMLEEMEKSQSVEQKVFEGEVCKACGHIHPQEEGHGHVHDAEESCGCGHHGHMHDAEESCGHHGHTHEEEEPCGCGHVHEGPHRPADEVFESWGIETHRKYTKDELQEMLEKLTESDEYGRIIRAKGMLPDRDGTWMYFDMVPDEFAIRDGSAQATGRICVIGCGLDAEKTANLFRVDTRHSVHPAL